MKCVNIRSRRKQKLTLHKLFFWLVLVNNNGNNTSNTVHVCIHSFSMVQTIWEKISMKMIRKFTIAIIKSGSPVGQTSSYKNGNKQIQAVRNRSVPQQ